MVVLLNLKPLRTRHAYTQEELARRAGITRGTLIRLETLEQEPRPSTIRHLARALGVKPADLMGPAA